MSYRKFMVTRGVPTQFVNKCSSFNLFRTNTKAFNSLKDTSSHIEIVFKRNHKNARTRKRKYLVSKKTLLWRLRKYNFNQLRSSTNKETKLVTFELETAYKVGQFFFFICGGWIRCEKCYDSRTWCHNILKRHNDTALVMLFAHYEREALGRHFNVYYIEHLGNTLRANRDVYDVFQF